MKLMWHEVPQESRLFTYLHGEEFKYGSACSSFVTLEMRSDVLDISPGTHKQHEETALPHRLLKNN